jgi:murein DD-endopeptidase MepM/ murein hydrolase activator NlpD
MRVLVPATSGLATALAYVRGVFGVTVLCCSIAGMALTLAPRAGSRGPGTSRVVPAEVEATLSTANFVALADSLSMNVDRLTSIPSVLPTIGTLSSRYTLDRYHPILHVTRPHRGIDIAAPMGAPVVAPAAGVVVAIASRPGYGLMLEIDHGRGLVTRYGHLSRVHVHEGQTITRGQLIADVGDSGLSTGPHLHYEIRVGKQAVDPLEFGP